MKRLLIVLFSIPFFASAQNKPLVIEGVSPNLYINHTVAPKENYYSVGRIYNVSPKEVAPYNNLILDSGLSLGKTLKIPLSATNFLQTGNAAGDEVLIPLYHIVSGKEGLYRISMNYNKLPVETLRQWNKLAGDAVGNNTKLVVGYLKVKKELSPLANMATDKPADNPAKVIENPDKTVIAKERVKPEASNEIIPPAKKLAKETPIVADKIKKEPVAEPVLKEITPVTKPVTYVRGKNFNGGVFKSDYDKQTSNKDVAGEKGEAAVFKSTSGWEDGKYYCLHNTSSPGTIVKVTNNSSGKSIYAKVLDIIPDIKQNSGLLVRISNAAAEELGAGDAKFDCTLSYSK
ncbi:MAG: LysM peptidoglycan-binding domain-containing protein [Ferruginibacter sp.]|nr:LysM peptidoglycan-binding domain-containing protein [Ferruginibacter sp.]